MKTRLDCLARSMRDLLNTLAQIAVNGASFRSLAGAWADTTAHRRRLRGRFALQAAFSFAGNGGASCATSRRRGAWRIAPSS